MAHITRLIEGKPPVSADFLLYFQLQLGVEVQTGACTCPSHCAKDKVLGSVSALK